MLNQVVLVGRLVEIKEKKEGASIILAVPEPYKNIDGIYETNLIEVRLYNKIADTTKEYCNKGDILGIKGRIRKLAKENEICVIAEKISFLTTTRKEDNE